jgi:hypothetical protein
VNSFFFRENDTEPGDSMLQKMEAYRVSIINSTADQTYCQSLSLPKFKMSEQKPTRYGTIYLIISFPSLSVHYEDLTRAIILKGMKIINGQLVGQCVSTQHAVATELTLTLRTKEFLSLMKDEAEAFRR